MRSFGQTLDGYKGFGPGFDFMRVFLALSVLAWHSIGIARGNYDSVKTTPLWISELVILPMFFALSGFLVAASATRLSLGNFLVNRGLRIVPALAVDIVVCALILGPYFTTLPLREYFTDHRFFAYFANIFGWIHFYLPGVFETNPSTKVNGALWTVPFEIGCYAVLSMLMLFRLHTRAWALALAGFGLLLAAFAVSSLGLLHQLSGLPHKIVDAALFGRGARLIPAFLLGALCYRLKDIIPYDWRIAMIFLAGGVAAAFLGNAAWIRDPLVNLIAAPLLAYLVVFAGLTPLPKLPLYSNGDYSYGIYLYHVPLQQTVCALMPGVAPLIVLALSWPMATCMAILSWHLVEKPVLSLRKSAAFAFWTREKQAKKPPTAEPAPQAVATQTES